MESAYNGQNDDEPQAMMKITLDTFRSYPLISVLSEDEARKIFAMVRYKALKRDEILILEGDFSEFLFFTIRGWLKAEKTSYTDGRQQTIRFIGPGEIINELATFSKNASTVTVLALEDAQVFYLSHAIIESLMVENPDFSRAVIKNLADRIQHLLALVESLSLFSVEKRLARYLLDESKDNLLVRQSWKTQTEIASRLGTVLDVVNRNLLSLAKNNIIEMDREAIRILDRQKLSNLADK